MSALEETLLMLVRAAGLPEPVREHRWHPERKWRYDLCWPDRMLAVEVEGGTWLQGGGRHNRGAGFEDDCVKYSTAAIMGWRVIRVTGDMISSGVAMELILQAVEPVQEASCLTSACF